MEFSRFGELLAVFAKVDNVKTSDTLFGGGLDLPSIAFLEFIMAVEEELGREVDVDNLDAGIRTVGQLYERLAQD